MKKSFSQIIAIACILTIGGIGLFSLVKSTKANPSHQSITHELVSCYSVEEMGGLPYYHYCDSWTNTLSPVDVFPDPHAIDAHGRHVHGPHGFQENVHVNDNVTMTTNGCSNCVDPDAEFND